MRRLAALLLVLLAALPATAGVIEGRVVRDGEPVAAITVGAYAGSDFSAPPAATAVSAADGSFRLEVAAGFYSLYARDPGRRLFAFCGRNPVTVGAEPVWAGLQAVTSGEEREGPYDDDYAGAIEGVVLDQGEPVAGAHVYLYLDAADDLKGQGYRLSPPTGADGAFAFDLLPESDYFLVARQRRHGGRVGPVREGDFLAVYGGNPVTARAGKTVRVVLPGVRKVRDESGSETFGRETGTTVSGRIVAPDGRPVAGLHVFAYTDRVVGHQRPAALSPPTGADGRFVLSLREGGTYYLGARERYGDSPAPGERYGMYDDTADHGLTLAAGEAVDGVRIVVEPIALD